LEERKAVKEQEAREKKEEEGLKEKLQAEQKETESGSGKQDE